MASVVIPGIWCLEGTRGSNVYLWQAADGQLALIDTGFASSAAAIEREIGTLGRGPLAMVLLTHSHPDHSGAAARVRALTGAPLVIGAGDAARRGEGWRLE